MGVSIWNSEKSSLLRKYIIEKMKDSKGLELYQKGDKRIIYLINTYGKVQSYIGRSDEQSRYLNENPNKLKAVKIIFALCEELRKLENKIDEA